MAVLHVTEQGARVRVRKGRFVVEKNGEVLATAPKHQVERVVLHGGIGLTTPALVFCLRRGVPVYFVSSAGRLYGKAAGAGHVAAHKLKAQLLMDDARRLQLSRAIIKSKLGSQLAYARLRHARAPCKSEDALLFLEESLNRLKNARTLDELRGIEGSAASAYFEVLACGWARYGFTSRNRRPPRDPVNAALSYGYAVLQSVVESAVVTAGLHPELGLLHSTTRRNPALVLDLMEEFRTDAVDRVVGRLFGRKQLDPNRHFSHGSHKTLLNRTGKGVLVRELEGSMYARRKAEKGGSLMEQIFQQAARLEAAIVRERPYETFFREKK